MSVAEAGHRSSTRWWLLGAVFALVVCQLLAAFYFVRPGPLSIDEVVYHWMTKSVSQGHWLTIANGTDQRPSAELAMTFMQVSHGHVFAQYPPFFAYITAPLYLLLGFRSLFVVNALALVAVVAFTYRVGRRLFPDRWVALGGCLVLVFATFAWEYSVAAWPHMLMLAAIMWAFDLSVAGLDQDRGSRRAGGLALGSGLVIGVAIGLRLDAVFAVPALLLPFAFSVPARWRESVCLVVGLLPSLVGLAVVNWIKWGVANPFTYGGTGGAYTAAYRFLPLGAAGLALLALVWSASRPRGRRWLASRKRTIAVLVVVAIGAALAVPATRGLIFRFGHGLRALLFDLRGERTNFVGGSQLFWAVTYMGGVKKALLQSCPYLPVVAVACLAAVRQHVPRRSLVLLTLVPATVLPFYSAFVWHGGMCLNMRYFLPALPFLSLASGVAVRELARGLDRRSARVIGGVALAACGFYLAVRPGPLSHLAKAATITVPLALVAVLVLSMLLWFRSETRGRKTLVLSVTVAAMVWSGLLAFDYDARWSRGIRAQNLERARAVAAEIEDGSLIFMVFPDAYVGVIEFRRDLTLAFPDQDRFQDFHSLAMSHLDAGRHVYAVFSSWNWNTFDRQPMMAGLEPKPSRRLGTGLMELVKTGEPAADAPGQSDRVDR